MAKIRKLTGQGQAVKGALSAYLSPKLAADRKLQRGELDKLLLAVKPDTTTGFKGQVKTIADSVTAAFKTRLAKDADLEDLPELLEALGEAAEEGEEYDAMPPALADEDMDEDLGEDTEGPGERLMAMLGELNLPADKLEAINQCINELAKGSGAAMNDAFPPAKKPPIPPQPQARNPKANAPEPTVTPQAMDAAINAGVKKAEANVAAKFQAGKDVAPFIGEVDVLAADSAESLYKMALDAAKVDTTGVPPAAFKAMVAMLPKPDAEPTRRTPVIAADAAALGDYQKQYPHIPQKL